MYLISRRESFAKTFFILSFLGLVMYIVLAFYSFHTAFKTARKEEVTQKKIKRYPSPETHNYDGIKHILLWLIPEVNYTFSKEGHALFRENKCEFRNCYVTTDKNLLEGDVTKFDAIMFSQNMLLKWKKNMPDNRSSSQKYVFYSMMPANEHPVCDVHADDFFNWTWTYKLYSDIATPFIEVRDLKGALIAPNLQVDWDHDILCQLNETKTIPKNKTMMFYRKRCSGSSGTLMFVKRLQDVMKDIGLTFNMYGCNKNDCNNGTCLKKLEKEYSFYLVVEDSMSDDYVSKEVLIAYNNNAIPVIVGGADYDKFLPPGSYIDARLESPEGLAGTIKYTVSNPNVYDRYFAWKNYYTITEAKIQRGYCELCDLLNDKERMERHSSYERFRKWWYYGNLKSTCLPKGLEALDDVLAYVENPDQRKMYLY